MHFKSNRSNPSRIIVFAGFLVGTLDIIAALSDFYIRTGKDPAIVLKFIASGVFGKKAFTAGSSMTWLGLLFHYLIAFGFTILFFLLYQRLKFMRWNWLITGFLYGVFIWLTMHYLILPLSKTSPVPGKPYGFIKPMLILIVMIGLPLAFIAKRYRKQESS